MDAAHFLAEWGVFEVRQASAMRAFGEEQVPEACFLRQRLEPVDQGDVRPAVAGRHLLIIGFLIGIDVRVHEGAQAGEQVGGFRVGIVAHA